MAMRFEEDFPVFRDDGTFALMGSELMGGAQLPPMTPQERQSYIDGIGIKAKYIGTTEVPRAQGGEDTYAAIARVRAAHKAHREAKQRTWLVISVSGLKIRDFDTRELRDSYALYQISYVTWLPSNPQVFAFITANATTTPPIYKCHVYKSHSKSRLIIETFGRCFTLAIELQRAGVIRAARIKDMRFRQVVHEMRRQLRVSRVPLDVASFCNEGLKRLTELYDAESTRQNQDRPASFLGSHSPFNTYDPTMSTPTFRTPPTSTRRLLARTSTASSALSQQPQQQPQQQQRRQRRGTSSDSSRLSSSYKAPSPRTELDSSNPFSPPDSNRLSLSYKAPSPRTELDSSNPFSPTALQGDYHPTGHQNSTRASRQSSHAALQRHVHSPSSPVLSSPRKQRNSSANAFS